MHLHNFQRHALPDARHAFLAVLGLLQYWYFWKCEVLVLILFLKISGIGIGIDILFEYGQYWYWYWYPFWKLSVLVFVLILTLKICRIDIDIDIVVLSYGMKYQYLLKRAGIAHLCPRVPDVSNEVLVLGCFWNIAIDIGIVKGLSNYW